MVLPRWLLTAHRRSTPASKIPSARISARHTARHSTNTHTMGSKFWPKRGSPGILHHYTETQVAYEFTSATNPSQPHSVLFLGGLGDGLATTSYVADVVQGLQPTEWSIFSLTLTSSYQGWGFGHLDRDTDEIAQCIRYIQGYKKDKFGSPGKIVVFGHSTGSQCVIHYLSRPNPHTGSPTFDPYLEHCLRPVLDGAIMQAPVSDREAILYIMRDGFLGRTPEELRETYDKLIALAKEGVERGGPFDTMLPITLTSQFGYSPNTPVSCRRFLSLVSPGTPSQPGDDDMFSSDLGKEQLGKTFGMIRERGLIRGKLTVLMSGADQSVPEWVDKEKLLSRWQKVADGDGPTPVWDAEHSGIIPGASHALSNDDQAEPRKWLVKRVLSYLATIAEPTDYELVGR
ncbi:hypothetical protein B0T16DRAFT_414862 [Cercophora newfieldiana]|uniref:Uncharacterized protein n=1 Tax=Cercophora newfieldiana TaxID=92897 RepID=A0AA40CLJ2_9PEZI|nr:hypothetical protein B0T16DRAFT_414862 [Cercophora newfieldiana]